MSADRWSAEAAAHDLAAEQHFADGNFRLGELAEEAATECRKAGRAAWLRENPIVPMTDAEYDAAGFTLVPMLGDDEFFI